MMTLDTFQNRWGRWAALLLLGLLCVLAFPLGVTAQESGSAADSATGSVTAGQATTETVQAGPPASQAVTANDVNDVARQLWCPLCSGVRLDACELKACAQMKDVIGEKLAGGEDAASIKNYFVAQYGPQVLGEPPMEGFNWLAWILPVLALLAGGLFVLSRVRPGARRAAALAGAGPIQPAAVGDAYSRWGDEELKNAGPNPATAAGDAYSRKLDEELKNYE